MFKRFDDDSSQASDSVYSPEQVGSSPRKSLRRSSEPEAVMPVSPKSLEIHGENFRAKFLWRQFLVQFMESVRGPAAHHRSVRCATLHVSNFLKPDPVLGDGQMALVANTTQVRAVLLNPALLECMR